MARIKGRTYYSEKIKGTPQNWDWLARFDITDGCLGITQFEGDAVKDRVLLSPAQVRQLLDFIVEKKPSKAA